jgi:PKD repeat protein/type 1 glutamine amidotransferase
MRRTSTAARRLALSGLAGLALIAPAPAMARVIDADASTAKTTAPLRSLSAPRQVLAGESFTVSARVANSAQRATRPRLVVRIRKYKYASGGRVLLATRVARLGAGDTRRVRVEVEVPESLAAGRYWLSACVRGRAGSSCRLSGGRLVVSHASPAPARAGQASPQQAPPATVAPSPPPPRYDVLAFTEAVGETHASVSDGIDALREVGARNRFRVTVASNSSGVFTESNLGRYRAVVFLNTAGDVLNDVEQTAFENYFKDGGGFLGIHSAIATETGWQFMTDLLGTRATGPAAALEGATIKVADRVHDASKSLPEYWQHSDEYYNFTGNVRGFQHVLATVDETTYTGGTMGFDHPVAWCQDYQGGRSFYTAVGHTRQAFRSDTLRRHLAGAVAWAAGESDPVYSDCGATVVANFQQTKVTAPPNINEPIGFDQLPDGRLIQTTRDGRVRLHDPATGSSDVIASLPVYTHSEDGLYGPAVDNNFAANKWVYLYYAPLTMDGIAQSGKPYPAQTPAGNAPTMAADPATFDDWMGYFQLSRFKFVDTAGGVPAHLDLDSEQKIMKVEVDRGACCHVAGDIDFDKHNNLWMVTGDDTPAGSVNVQQFPPFNDMKTNETQSIAVANATGGTFTLTFDGRTTGPIPFPLDNAAIEAALEALPNITDVAVATGQGGARTVNFRGGLSQEDVPQMTADASGLTSDTTATVTITTTTEGNWFLAPHNDARRSSTSTNDLRGKVLRIKVNADGSYSIPKGNLFREGTARTRPEIYAMGFRNPFRIQVDSKGVAYVTDYSPDSRAPTNFRGPAGTGRVEVVRKPSSYGWPMCYAPNLPMYQWDFNTQTSFGEQFECDDPDQGPANTSRWNTGLRHGPPITQPDIWYSYNDNAAPPQGTPCLAYYDGSGGTCPQLFPELGTGGVGPHGAATYEFDPDNPSETKFPPYYDGAMILGEFTRDWLREVRFDSRGGIHKINNVLNCGAALQPTPSFPFECDSPMDMQFGSDGAFYLLTYGDGFFNANPDAGLYKWEYVAGSQKPRAVMSATPTNGTAPLQVQFSSTGSSDPDENDSIRFDWDFGVPGTDADQSTDPNPTYTYTANGVYTARLTVTDSEGKTDVKTIQITVGNTAPTVAITTPVDGDFFEFGDDIPYAVTVTDPEDGPVDCNRVQVTFVLLHDQHGHAEASQNACSGVLPTSAEDSAHGGYLAGGVSVTYTDLGANGQPALSSTVQSVIQRRKHEVEFVQEGRGVQFVSAPATEPGGGQSAAQIDPGDWLGLNNRFSFGNMDDQITFRYAGGANNVPVGTPRMVVDVRRDAVDGPVVATCTLTSTGTNNNTYTEQTCPLTGDVTGSFKVYLTFRQATGGPATQMGNLNWVSFSGPGVGT